MAHDVNKINHLEQHLLAFRQFFLLLHCLSIFHLVNPVSQMPLQHQHTRHRGNGSENVTENWMWSRAEHKRKIGRPIRPIFMIYAFRHGTQNEFPKLISAKLKVIKIRHSIWIMCADFKRHAFHRPSIDEPFKICARVRMRCEQFHYFQTKCHVAHEDLWIKYMRFISPVRMR